MSKLKTIKKQRDQFLGFAFASADLFLEISDSGKVIFVLGAAKGITGIKDQDLVGKKWVELFSTYDQARLLDLYEASTIGRRVGPLLVDLNELITKRKAIFTGIKMPGSDNFYITLGFSNMVMSQIAGIKSSGKGELQDQYGFIDEVKEAFDFGRSLGQDLDLTVFDFGRTEEIKEEIGDEKWGAFIDDVVELFQSESLGGKGVGEIGEGRYSFVHDPDVDMDFVRSRIDELIEEHAPLCTGFDVSVQTVHADLDKVSEWEAEKALVYTVSAFKDEDIKDFKIEHLSQGVKTFATDNKDKLTEFLGMLERVDFSLYFQPVVSMATEEVDYYEILTRFDRGETLEWIMFAEDLHLASTFDIAVCDRAVSHISFKAGGSRTKFAVNLSPQSIQETGFIDKLQEQLEKGQKLEERLRFEVTDTLDIENNHKAEDFITALQNMGYSVTLDDFGVGAAALNLLDVLHPNGIKIDRQHIQSILSSPREEVGVREMVKACKERGISVVAEFIEKQEQADLLKEIGVECGQGYMFGAAENSPSFQPPKK